MMEGKLPKNFQLSGFHELGKRKKEETTGKEEQTKQFWGNNAFIASGHLFSFLINNTRNKKILLAHLSF